MTDEQLPFDGGETPYIESPPRVAHTDMCEECGNYPAMIGYRICEECARRDLMQYGGLEGEPTE